MTQQQLGDLRERTGQPRISGPRVVFPPKPSKYKAVKCVDPATGEKFDSKAEYRRWQVLRMMASVGRIRNLERQPKFPIVLNDKKICTYIADFRYVRTDSLASIVEDVKGMKTPVYRLKKKLVEAIHGIKITEITK